MPRYGCRCNLIIIKSNSKFKKKSQEDKMKMTERAYDPVLCLKAFLWWGIHVFVNPSYNEEVGSYM